MSSMETAIVLISLIASGVGSLVLLAALAARRAELVKAYNIQVELQKEQALAANDAPTPDGDVTAVPAVH